MSGRERIPASAAVPAAGPLRRDVHAILIVVVGIIVTAAVSYVGPATRSLTAQMPVKVAPEVPQDRVGPPIASSPATEPPKAPDLPPAPPADAQPAASPVPMVTLATGAKVKLGRQRPTRRPKIWLHDYLRRAPTAAVPASVDYYTKAAPAISQVYGNDFAGNCVIASGMHQEAVFTAAGLGTPAVGTSAEAIATYHEFCGPGDNGCNIMAVLDRRKAGGIKVGGKAYKILDYVGVDWRQQQLLETAIYLFGAVEFGVNLPRAWESAPTWDVVSSPIVGGHDIPGFGFDPAGITISTWGGTRKLTWRAATSTRYVEEAYVILSENWSKNPDLAKLGIDVAALQADLALIAQGKPPTIPPTPPPAPVPVPVDPPAPVTPPIPSTLPVVGTLPAPADIFGIRTNSYTGGQPTETQWIGSGQWYQVSRRDGKCYAHKEAEVLRDWIARYDAAKPGEPVTPSPQAPPYTVTGTISINGGPALPLAIGGGTVAK